MIFEKELILSFVILLFFNFRKDFYNSYYSRDSAIITQKHAYALFDGEMKYQNARRFETHIFWMDQKLHLWIQTVVHSLGKRKSCKRLSVCYALTNTHKYFVMSFSFVFYKIIVLTRKKKINTNQIIFLLYHMPKKEVSFTPSFRLVPLIGYSMWIDIELWIYSWKVVCGNRTFFGVWELQFILIICVCVCLRESLCVFH